ncbi:granzyme E-like [Anableps anableps]
MFIYCNPTVLMLVLIFQSQVNSYVIVITINFIFYQKQVHAGKVIGGHEVTSHTRPYMVLIEMVDQNNEKKHCGGFLINDEFVMTAAHCQAKSYKAFLGLLKYNTNHKTHSVKQAFPHENYNETEFTNDIMLLKLSEKVTWTHHVKSIDLADKQGSSLPNSCSVCGWGPTSQNDRHMSSALMEATVTLIDNELCIKENVYCSEGESGPSGGDSGGPLVCEDGKAYGVVSASKPSGSSTLYKYTKIPDYIDWINGIINHN